MLGHSLILIPIFGFVLAAGTGFLVRARRSREDKNVRDDFSITQ